MTEVKRPLSLHLSPSNASTEDQTFSAIKRSALGGASRPTARGLTKSSSVTSTQTLCSTTSTSSYGSSSSSSSSNSNSSNTTTAAASGYASPDSPSLILPYLYVGDQAQTQIDTISNLNIKYILSLQSLPKFLDTPSQSRQLAAKDARAPSASIRATHHREAAGSQQPDRTYHAAQRPAGAIIRSVDGDEVEIETQINDNQGEAHERRSEQQQEVERKQSLTDGQAVGCGGGGCWSGDGAAGSSSAANSPLCGATDSDDTIARELLPSANSSKDYLVKFKSCVNRLIKGKCINISDTFETLVDKFFDETHNFIEEARRNKCNILVHCKAGISRSPTIAIAYLMKWKRLHLQEAYEFVKQCRPQISPNLNFMGQLMNYERQLLQRGAHRPTSWAGSLASPACMSAFASVPSSPLSFCLPGPSSFTDGEQTTNESTSPESSQQRQAAQTPASGHSATTTKDDLNSADTDPENEQAKGNLIIRVTA